eukprot:m.135738 g.135738  ORF g.135738 m.135738 type:complete len:115 (+) comp14716_c0_seq12:613-957(+)
MEKHVWKRKDCFSTKISRSVRVTSPLIPLTPDLLFVSEQIGKMMDEVFKLLGDECGNHNTDNPWVTYNASDGVQAIPSSSLNEETVGIYNGATVVVCKLGPDHVLSKLSQYQAA